MSRVILFSFNYEISPRIQRYAGELVEHGVEVDLVVADRRRTELLEELDQRVRVHPVMAMEPFPVRVEQLILFRAPGALLSRLRKLAGGGGLGRAAEAVERGYLRAAGAFHHRVFMLFYRNIRPLVLARRFRSVTSVDVASADRIVAADISAIALGWRLARQYPDIVATTALDIAPFRDKAARS